MKYIYLAFLFIFYSCSPHKKDSLINNYSLPVDLDQTVVKKTSDLFSAVDVIPLESGSDQVIGKVGKFLIHGNRLFIGDPDLQQVFVFGPDGFFVSKIGKVGKGPGEYSTFKDFIITRDSIIEILDRYKIVKYSQNGKFLDEIRLEKELRTSAFFHNYNEGYFFYSLAITPNNRLVYRNNSGELNGLLRKLPNFLAMKAYFYPRRSVFSTNFNGQIVFQEVHANNQVFNLSADTVKPYINFDFGPYNFNYKSDLPAGRDKAFYKDYLGRSDFAHYSYFYTENKQFIITALIHKLTNKTLIYDKNSGNIQVIEALKAGGIFPQGGIFHLGEYCVVIPAYFIDRYVPMEQLTEANQAILKTVNKTTDNPVLFRFRLKNF